MKQLYLKTIISKKMLAAIMVAMTLGYQCAGDSTDKEHTESAVPAELKDSIEEVESHNEALKHLESIIDTAQGH